jgi:hypothetical protein
MMTSGEIATPWTTPLTETVAFVIELLDGEKVRYRIYYNDASPDSPLGQTTGDIRGWSRSRHSADAIGTSKISR